MLKIVVSAIILLSIFTGCSGNNKNELGSIPLEEVVAQASAIPTFYSWEKKLDLKQVYYANVSEKPLKIYEYLYKFLDFYGNHESLEGVDEVYYVFYSLEDETWYGTTTLYYSEGELIASMANSNVYLVSITESENPSEIENYQAYEWEYCNPEYLHDLKELF